MPKFDVMLTIEAPDIAAAVALILYPEGDPVRHINDISEMSVIHQVEQTETPHGSRSYPTIPARDSSYPTLVRDETATELLEAQADVG